MKKNNKIKKRKRWLIILLLISILLIAFKYNYYNLKDNFQTLLNNTISFVNTKSSDLERIIANGKLINDDELSSLEDSGITGENYNNNATYYPYYELLDSNEQTLYKQIYANINALSTTFVPNATITSVEVTNALEAVYNDHAELFWLNTSYSYKYTKNGNVVQIILSFNDTANNINETKNKFNKSAQKIINAADKLNSNYEKEKYVHDAIIKIADYNLNSQMNQSAYSALVNGSTVCAGYARAFQYIMIELKIPTYYVTGYSNGDHAWNIVKLSDGYYNIDLTWDDTNPTSYKYFNLTDADITNSHTRTGYSTSLPSCTATTYRYLETNSNNNKSNSTTNNKSNNNTSNNSNNSSNSLTNDNNNNNSNTQNNNTDSTNTNNYSNQETTEESNSSNNSQTNSNTNDYTITESNDNIIINNNTDKRKNSNSNTE